MFILTVSVLAVLLVLIFVINAASNAGLERRLESERGRAWARRRSKERAGSDVSPSWSDGADRSSPDFSQSPAAIHHTSHHNTPHQNTPHHNAPDVGGHHGGHSDGGSSFGHGGFDGGGFIGGHGH